MPLTEREVGLLWRYHDWLASHGYVVCERVYHPERTGWGAYTYQPVHAQEVADLLARFMVNEAGSERREAEEDQATEGEGNDGSEL